MKKNVLIFVFIAVVLALITGCTLNNIPQITTPVPNTQPGTPSPNGQINVPAVSIDINWPGPNPLVNEADTRNRVAGILSGIWHGIISPVTLVVSFMNPSVQMYEVHNDGSQYNLGYLIGVAIVFLLLGVSTGRRRH